MKLALIQPATVATAAREILGARLVDHLDQRAADVVPFAQRGYPTPALARVLHALFMPPARPMNDWMRVKLALPEGEALDAPRGQLLTVVLAARGRMRLREGCIEVTELAALASCGARNIRVAIARRHLERVVDTGRSGPVTAKTAIRFLAARGVPPWGDA